MSRPDEKDAFRRPSALEQAFNRLFGVLVSLGGGLRDNYLLQVRGRKSGRMFSTPVNLLEIGLNRYLVAPRGNTQWVRNVRSSSRLELKKGTEIRRFHARELSDADKPAILKEYLTRYRKTVQRYFSVPADSDLDRFTEIANRHPVFELKEIDDGIA